MKGKLPEWVTTYRDRHGKPRFRFRRKGFRPYTFKSTPDQGGFWKEYQDCLAGVAAEVISAGADRTIPGSFDDLISRYYRSPEFLNTGERTQVVYRGVIESFRKTYGKALVRDLEPRHIRKMLADKVSTPTAANMLRKRLRALMHFAIAEQMRRDDPTVGSKPYKIKSKGFHTWEEDEISQYEARHPVGTKARLALDLMLWTGQRPGDARVMGRQHIREGRLVVDQEKRQGEVVISLPLLAPLAESIVATPSGHLTFLVTDFGRPFSPKGFGNKMRQWCDEAGLPQCSAHGLRKAAARRFAEAGCSNQEIKSWTGHSTDSEVSRYTKDVDQLLMSDHAATKLRLWMANRETGLANDPAKSLEGGD